MREIQVSEFSKDEKENLHKDISTWTTELRHLPTISHKQIHKYFVSYKDEDRLERGATKHKIAGYQLFKEGYVKGMKVKPNVDANIQIFIVKCFDVASMKKFRYQTYIHLCQKSGAVCYAKCNCKAGAGGCCKHVAAVLYQLVEYTQLCLSSIPTDKTCTDVLQIWHVPGEAANDQPTLFSTLRFVKENLRKDTTVTRDAGSTLGHRGSNFFKGHFWAWHTKKNWAWHIKNETLYSVNCESKLFNSAPVLNIFDK